MFAFSQVLGASVTCLFRVRLRKLATSWPIRAWVKEV